MKNIFIKCVIIFWILLFANCKNTLDLYTTKDGCVFINNTRTLKLFGDIDTSYLSSKKNIRWNLIYIIKNKFLRDRVIETDDSLQEILITDSNTIISRNYFYNFFQGDSIKLLNLVLNKDFFEDVIYNNKSFEIMTKVGKFELKLMSLSYPIAVIYNKETDEYYIFRAKSDTPY
ncbi:MAG: hypothetical protein V4613_02920 [Bacteroidota bacterium]